MPREILTPEALTPHDFLLPDLGEGLTEAEIVSWLVKPGDVIAIDQVVVEVESAKSVVELPSPFGGRVVTLHAAAGEVVHKGSPLITVVPVGAELSADAGASVDAEAPVDADGSRRRLVRLIPEWRRAPARFSSGTERASRRCG